MGTTPVMSLPAFHSDDDACCRVSVVESMPVIWNSVQPRSPVGGPAGAAVLASSTMNSPVRKIVDRPAGAVIALVAVVTVLLRLASVKLPNEPAPKTTVIASGAPAAPLLIQIGARRIDVPVLFWQTRSPVWGMLA